MMPVVLLHLIAEQARKNKLQKQQPQEMMVIAGTHVTISLLLS
jgi:hypothetical protein